MVEQAASIEDATTSPKAQDAGGVTSYVILSGLTAASSGLIFGYNIGISGGVTSMTSFLEHFFPSVIQRSKVVEQSNYCKFNDQGLQAFTSCLYLAGLASTFGASYVTSRYGRRITMIIAGIISLAGVALTSGAQNFAMLIVGRILLGCGAGFANQAAPIYLSEIAPTNLRGVLNAMFQLNITIGIFCANIVNFAVGYLKGSLSWRIALLGAGVPALMLTLGGLLLLESPISLIERGKLAQGRSILQKVRGKAQNVELEFEEMVRACEIAKSRDRSSSSAASSAVFRANNRPQLIISSLFAVFQQMTGINAIMFYAPVLFDTVGFKSNASLYSAAIIGGVNVASTIASMFVVERMGRKALLLEGGFQMILSQLVIGAILAATLKDVSAAAGGVPIPHSSAIVVVLLTCTFVAGFGWSWGPLTWLICSEIYPLDIRSTGQSIVVFANLVATFIIAQAFLSMLCAMKYGIFFFFGAWLVLMTAFVALFMPETKGIPLESIELLWRKHWFWKKLVPPAIDHLPVSTDMQSDPKMKDLDGRSIEEDSIEL